MRSVVVIGGTGLIGRAVARRLLAAGWQVTVTGRDPRCVPIDLAAAGARFMLVDRDDPVRLAAAVGAGPIFWSTAPATRQPRHGYCSRCSATFTPQ